jgi:GNAT superfamily N-acetyltransferase
MTTTDDYELRAARPDELQLLLSVEDDAGRLYGSVGMPDDLPGLPLELLSDGLARGLLWVVAPRGEPPVGFALCWLRGDAMHLRELDVCPDHGRRGLGARLLEHVAAQARERGCSRVTLTTFSEVPWNRTYYERHGFERMAEAELPEWLAAERKHEAQQGLDRWPRLAMQRVLAA